MEKNNKEIVSGGTFLLDKKDPNLKAKLVKFLTALNEGDETYRPFRKVK